MTKVSLCHLHILALHCADMMSSKINWDTNPKAAEIRVGVVVCFVVCLHQCGNDVTLFIWESRSPCFLFCFTLCLLVLPPLNQVLLSLHFLIRQNDCKAKTKRTFEIYTQSKLNFQMKKKEMKCFLWVKIAQIKQKKNQTGQENQWMTNYK